VSNVPPCPAILAAFLALGGSASDNCDSDLTYSCSDGPLVGGFCGGSIARMHTVTDASSNSASCVQIVTVSDTTPPVVTCPPDQTRPWTNGAAPAFGMVTANDTCDTNVTVTFVDGELPATCPAVRVFRRTWTATDDCDNQTTCSQTITFVDASVATNVLASHSIGCYARGGTNTVTCTIRNQTCRRLLSLVWEPILPAGWALLSVSGDGGPEIGPDRKIVFLAAGLTNEVLAFSYTASAPAGEQGGREIRGALEYHLEGDANASLAVAVPDPLLIADCCHSADCDCDRVIDSTEVAFWRIGGREPITAPTSRATASRRGWVTTVANATARTIGNRPGSSTVWRSPAPWLTGGPAATGSSRLASTASRPVARLGGAKPGRWPPRRQANQV
jgi:hypothetical protein